jgi:hypothetical protein
VIFGIEKYPSKDGTATEFTLHLSFRKLKTEFGKGEQHAWNCGYLDIDVHPSSPTARIGTLDRRTD